MTRFVLQVFTSLLIVLSPSGFAATIDAYYCVTYNLDYEDGDTGDLLTGSSTPARGAKLQLERSNGSIEWIYLDWDGSEAGCGWFNNILVDNNETFNVRLVRHAYVNGNHIKVWTDDTANQYLFSSLLATGHHPENGIGYSYYTGPSASIHIMATAAWALQRRDGGFNATYNFIDIDANDPNPPNPLLHPASYYDQGNHNIYIHYANDTFKFVIAHELGHAISHVANEFDDYFFDGDAVQNGCSDAYDRNSIYINSKEFMSAALVEGLGSWYAAVAFNHDGSGDDCEFELTKEGIAGENDYNIDWNANAAFNDAEPDVFSCETSFSYIEEDENGNQYNYTIRGYGYIDQYCLNNGASDNRGTVIDVLRHLWDLTTDYSLGVDDIFQIWNLANPDSWETSGSGTGGDYPAERMHDAARDVGGANMQDDYDESASFNWAHLGCGSC